MKIEDIIKQTNISEDNFEIIVLETSEYDYDSDTYRPTDDEIVEKLSNSTKKNIIIKSDSLESLSLYEDVIKCLNELNCVIFDFDVKIYYGRMFGKLKTKTLCSTGKIDVYDSDVKIHNFICEKMESFASNFKNLKGIVAKEIEFKLTNIDGAEVGSGATCEDFVHTDHGIVLDSTKFNIISDDIKGIKIF